MILVLGDHAEFMVTLPPFYSSSTIFYNFAPSWCSSISWFLILILFPSFQYMFQCVVSVTILHQWTDEYFSTQGFAFLSLAPSQDMNPSCDALFNPCTVRFSISTRSRNVKRCSIYTWLVVNATEARSATSITPPTK